MSKIEDIMNERGCSWSQAKYISESFRRKGEYKAVGRNSYSPSDPLFQNYTLVRDLDSEYGWKLLNSRGKEKKLSVYTTKQGYTSIRANLCVNNKETHHSLASLIWLLYLDREIPAGYVVDHIDNNPFNNDPDNLQLLTTRENLLKNSSADYKRHFMKMEKQLDKLQNKIIEAVRKLSSIKRYKNRETLKHANAARRVELLKAARENLLNKYNKEMNFYAKLNEEIR